MNVHVSYKVSRTPDLEKLIQQQTDKLQRYLRVFRPDLVHLKGIVEENSAPQGFVVSLNLRLPSGQMAAQENSATGVAAVKAAFGALTEQLKKHKELLRNQHSWPRRHGARSAVVGTVPFEDTLAAMKPEKVSAGDIFNYVDVNLPRLRLFIERELRYRESQGQLRPEQIAVDDVLDEAVSTALSDQDQPEKIKLEPWLYRLSREAISRLATEGGEEAQIPLERTHDRSEIRESDEPVVQFRKWQEPLFEENVIPDSTESNPEELAARSELMTLVETTLEKAGHNQREAFLLYTIEGFTLNEIADITSHTVEEVRAYIRNAREHLQRALPMKDPLKDKLVEYSRSA